MRYVTISIMPIVLYVFLSSVPSKLIDHLLSIELIAVIGYFLILVAIFKKHINIKYFAISSWIGFPISFVSSFFILFYLVDYLDKANFIWLTELQQNKWAYNLIIFIPMVTFHFFNVFLISKIFEYFKPKE